MNETALIVKEDRAVAVTQDQMALIKKTIAPPDATDAELQLFVYDCTRRGTHPLDRMIHFTKRGGKYTPITGIDFMRTRAAETGEYCGSDDAVFTGEPGKSSFEAKVTVYRHVCGASRPFTATARWSEYYPGDAQGHMWRKMPHTMLAKCAEALALRKGFPQQISGLYTAEEMAQAGEPDAPKPRVMAIRPTDPTPAPPVAATIVTTAKIVDSEPLPRPAGPGDDAMFAEPDLGPDDDAPQSNVYITKLDKRSGEKNGKPWTQWFITLSDGRTGSFFNGQLGVSAEAAKASNAPVIATFEQAGKFTNLTNLLRAD